MSGGKLRWGGPADERRGRYSSNDREFDIKAMVDRLQATLASDGVHRKRTRSPLEKDMFRIARGVRLVA